MLYNITTDIKNIHCKKWVTKMELFAFLETLNCNIGNKWHLTTPIYMY